MKNRERPEQPGTGPNPPKGEPTAGHGSPTPAPGRKAAPAGHARGPSRGGSRSPARGPGRVDEPAGARDRASPHTDLDYARAMAELARLRSEAARTYRIGIVMGMAVGAAMVIAGFVLSALGLSGSIEWLVQSHGITAKLTNAGPGVVFAAMGVVVLWRYKPVMRDRVDLGDDLVVRDERQSTLE